MQKITLYRVLLFASWLILPVGTAGAQASADPSLKALLEYPIDESGAEATAQVTQPVITAAPVQKAIQTPAKKTPQKSVQKKPPVQKIAKAPDPVPVPSRKPQRAPKQPKAPVNLDVTTYAIPSQFLVKPGTAMVSVPDEPEIIPEAPKPKQQAAPEPVPEPAPEVIPDIASVIAPKVLPEIVSFPVKASIKKMGDLDPGKDVTVTTTATGLEEETHNALAAAMAMMDGSDKGYWWQANPKVLFDEIPVPKSRPAKGMASETFVREARQQFVETYTIVKRDGDKMPAVPKAKVAKEPLAAPRLSIADIPGDMLANQIVDMSPQEVANALNAMTPVSSRDQAHLRRELNAVSKPRIVREQGEWIRRGKSAPAETSGEAETAQPSLKDKIKNPFSFLKGKEPAKEQVQETPAVTAALTQPGPMMVVYNAGEIEIPAQFIDLISRNIVTAMKNAPESRVQIIAYAAAPDGKEATARRTSLSRALSVRSYLIAQGIDATRLDVRAMGLQPDQKAEADKVDMILVPAQSAKKT